MNDSALFINIARSKNKKKFIYLNFDEGTKIIDDWESWVGIAFIAVILNSEKNL